jgi:predicted esterase
MSDQELLSVQWPQPFDGTPDAVVIWLHGLGADASDFPPTVPYLELNDQQNVLFLFPNAPVVPVTVNGGWEMRAWYDILLMEQNQRVINEDDLEASVRRLEAIVVNAINQGVPANRIFLVGFSQGGAVAYEAALRISPNIGGVVAMSTYLARELHTIEVAASSQLPILVLHANTIHRFEQQVTQVFAEFTLAASNLIEQGFDHMGKFGDVIKAECTGPTFDGVCGSEDGIDRLVVFGIQIQEAIFHDIKPFEALLQEGWNKLGQINAHEGSPHYFFQRSH